MHYSFLEPSLSFSSLFSSALLLLLCLDIYYCYLAILFNCNNFASCEPALVTHVGPQGRVKKKEEEVWMSECMNEKWKYPVSFWNMSIIRCTKAFTHTHILGNLSFPLTIIDRIYQAGVAVPVDVLKPVRLKSEATLQLILLFLEVPHKQDMNARPFPLCVRSRYTALETGGSIQKQMADSQRISLSWISLVLSEGHWIALAPTTPCGSKFCENLVLKEPPISSLPFGHH